MTLESSILGFTIKDRGNNDLLYDPTVFYYDDEGEQDGSFVVPLIYDTDSFTVFRNKTAVDEIAEEWAGFFEETECFIAPLEGILKEKVKYINYRD